MLTILLTCLLGVGQTFYPPTDWQIDSIHVVGRSWDMITTEGKPSGKQLNCERFINGVCEGEWAAEMKLRRQILVGQEITIPDGCRAKVQRLTQEPSK